MSPELKAFRFYKKNINFYLEEIAKFYDDEKKLSQMYLSIAQKFGADYKKFKNIIELSYNRSVDRAFR